MRISYVIAVCLLMTCVVSGAQSTVVHLTLATSINPVSRDMVLRTLQEAEAIGAELVVIELNTPGGLDSSTRDIVAALLGSSTPVAVYVSPSGARAASAGTLITLAAHIAAMAPGTSIGAAHPVNLMGAEQGAESTTSMDKAVRDAAAFARAIAEQRGRNVAWAEEAVVQSSALSATEALASRVIDLIAEDLVALLQALEGRSAQGGVLELEGAVIHEIKPTWRERLLGLLADPNLVYVLFILGLYGLIYEFFHPGVGLGLALGGVCLLVALFGLQILSVNITGIALILFGAGLLALDPFTPTHGILTAGGIVSLLAGSLTLFDLPDRAIGLSIGTVILVVGSLAALSVFVFSKGLLIQRKRPLMGRESMVGARAVVCRDLVPDGTVLIRGEYWDAWALDGTVPAGETVSVEGIERRTLLVRRTHGVSQTTRAP